MWNAEKYKRTVEMSRGQIKLSHSFGFIPIFIQRVSACLARRSI